MLTPGAIIMPEVRNLIVFNLCPLIREFGSFSESGTKEPSTVARQPEPSDAPFSLLITDAMMPGADQLDTPSMQTGRI
jgi:hypothetical protein